MSTSVLEPPQVEDLYRTLEEKVRALRPKEDLAPLDRAYRFSAQQHRQQKRKSGEPYITHPLAVAHILADMQMDLVSIETGLLHDVVEDRPLSSTKSAKNLAMTWPAASMASLNSAKSVSPTAKIAKPKAFAKCCSP